MTRLFFVVNELADADFFAAAARHLSDCVIDVGTALPPGPEQYRLVVLWNYRKIIRALPASANVILFHSSDLPRGRGWAPIYHALAERDTHYTITGLFAADAVDSGDVIVKARFPILPNYTAPDLRRFDSEISIVLIRRILERFAGRQITGVPQQGMPTYRARRTPADGELDVSLPLSQLIPRLRAGERAHPGFFIFEGARYNVFLEAAEPAAFPEQLDIDFGAAAP